MAAAKTSEMSEAAKAARSRGWCFTMNNPTEWDETLFQKAECTYIVYGKEHFGERPADLDPSEPWTPHLQGYMYMPSQRTMSSMKKNVHPRCHWEPAKGTADQNYKYCTKEGLAFEHGERPKAGKRTDLDDIRDIVMKDGGNMRDVVEKSTSYQAMKMGELMMKYQPAPKAQDEAPKTVRWYWGATGTGKTRSALAEAREISDDVWISGRDLKWWEGYYGQKCVIIDDFRGDFCTYHTLLRYLDRYPMRVEYKGSSTWLRATHIWITSPRPPTAIYSTVEDIGQLLRRITEVKEFNAPPQGPSEKLATEIEALFGETK